MRASPWLGQRTVQLDDALRRGCDGPDVQDSGRQGGVAHCLVWERTGTGEAAERMGEGGTWPGLRGPVPNWLSDVEHLTGVDDGDDAAKGRGARDLRHRRTRASDHPVKQRTVAENEDSAFTLVARAGPVCSGDATIADASIGAARAGGALKRGRPEHVPARHPEGRGSAARLARTGCGEPRGGRRSGRWP